MPVIASEQKSLECNGYNIVWDSTRNKQGNSTITVYQNKQNVFRVADADIEVHDYCNRNFLGNKSHVVIVNSWSGGAHCCNT